MDSERCILQEVQVKHIYELFWQAHINVAVMM